jgi:2-methylisocitrate lyase-like PEP mutase family enzyme
MTRRRMLRQLMSDQRGLVVPGAYDGVSAKLVERAGFPVFNELIGVAEQFALGERYSG